MKLEIGYEFERRGKKFCILDMLNIGAHKYILVSVEQKGEKLDYDFYELTENVKGYHFEKVIDSNIVNQLFDMERSENEGR